MSSPIKDCLNCEENSTCYECYILSGQEEKDLRANNASPETLKRFGYKEEEMFYCGICELEHELSNTGCVQPDPNDAIIHYEDIRGV